MTPWDVSIAGSSGEQQSADVDSAAVALLPQTFSFELDDDLVKVVTVSMAGQTCHVNIRYGRDVLLHEEDHQFDVASPVAVETTRFGVIVRSSRPGIPWFGRRLVRKF